MAKRKEAIEEVEPAGKDGFHWWEREFFLNEMGKLLKRLEADPSLIPIARLDGEGIWLGTKPVGKALSANGDDGEEGFNNSHPCPPFCPGPDDGAAE